jgi:hypothetical protein
LAHLDIIVHNMHHDTMRTTLNLDDDVYDLVRSYSEGRSQPLGKIVSELVRRAVRAPLRTRLESGFHVVDLPPDSPSVTTEDVKRIEFDDE